MGDNIVGNIVGNSPDITGDGAVGFRAAATVRQLDFTRHQGQVGHRGSQVQLEPRLDPAEIAGLADAQLDQSGQPMLHHHAARSILVVGGALLQRPGLLQQGFLGMDQHPPSLPALGRDALGPQWTCPTFGPVELEGLQAVDQPRATRPLSRRHDGVGNLAREGCTWRALPEEFGHWGTVYRRFVRWQEQGVFDLLFRHFVERHGVDPLMVDGTIVHVHQDGTGARKIHGTPGDQAIGHSRGGAPPKSWQHPTKTVS